MTLSVVGDSVTGSCAHVQSYFPNPTIVFPVTGTITSGMSNVWAGPSSLSVARADASILFDHAHCEGIASTNKFHINTAVPGSVWMGEEAEAPAHVGDPTTHCGGPPTTGGVGIINGPGAAGVG